MFKFFKAVGVKYNRDKNGKIINVAKKVHGSGVVKDCPETPGAIMRQIPRLLRCDHVSYTLWDIS